MANDFAASVTGAVIRVTRLNADGTCATGPSASYIDKGFLSVSFTPEIEEGDEFTQKNASGIVCTTFKAPDTLKRVTLELAICNPNPEITEMIAGGTVLTSAGATMGYAAPLSGEDPNPNGVALEVWSYAIVGGKKASVNPFWHWVFPYVHLTPSGDRVIENGIMANAFSGWGVGNSQFGDGPAGDWPFISDRAYQYARTATAPINLNNGYATVTP
jgi:hypothetical protein